MQEPPIARRPPCGAGTRAQSPAILGTACWARRLGVHDVGERSTHLPTTSPASDRQMPVGFDEFGWRSGAAEVVALRVRHTELDQGGELFGCFNAFGGDAELESVAEVGEQFDDGPVVGGRTQPRSNQRGNHLHTALADDAEVEHERIVPLTASPPHPGLDKLPVERRRAGPAPMAGPARRSAVRHSPVRFGRRRRASTNTTAPTATSTRPDATYTKVLAPVRGSASHSFCGLRYLPTSLKP
ncbi:hypothetical protein C8E86_5451 [Catellatospora citrea]|nr:hypothetical protein C8E86_5451 [Catellatospora citrea]